ncbi:undecaprenyl-diphosphate phosphatase [Pontivivens nitratireducens]|uniref:Undecaprenyl-diphosphatase n=1 Tax=Pontivivens nitratireducens TaxID=2758038 RepID=A0A6G7VJ75_9RHOB|nr:undecaprenyl-diphosphate phosphatase [Pontibrevibacter nitratireducens]QIK39847.1 undecaprenyl-diphosphate phosphatase [Pontibrevibacter nitratireducens]
MPLFDLLLLALIQGITEFLPISSSGHLILLPALMGTADQGVTLDVAVHMGTLVAVVAYFRSDVALALRGVVDVLRGRFRTSAARLALTLAVATVPVVIAGLILKLTGWSDQLRSIAVIGWAMLIFGVVLYWADRIGAQRRKAESWTIRDALIMGLWQAVALIPGTSRSGITITGARFLGYDRIAAARLSMLMSIPTILLAGGLIALDIPPASPEIWRDAAIAAVFAGGAALIALALMMRFLQTVSYTPYVIYRIVLGLILLGVAYI